MLDLMLVLCPQMVELLLLGGLGVFFERVPALLQPDTGRLSGRPLRFGDQSGELCKDGGAGLLALARRLMGF